MRAHYIRGRTLALTNDLAGQLRQCRRWLVQVIYSAGVSSRAKPIVTEYPCFFLRFSRQIPRQYIKLGWNRLYPFLSHSLFILSLWHLS